MDSSDYMKLAVYKELQEALQLKGIKEELLELAVYKELQEALQLKGIKEELLEYLGASLRWLFHYSKKYKIPLPENKKIDLVIDRTLEIANKILIILAPKNQYPF
jgi:hypothetical protein